MKTCSSCQQELPLSLFYNSKVSSDGKGYRCKTCDGAARKAYHKKHPEKVRNKQRDNRRKWAYDLNKEDFEKLLAKQSGKCGICCVELDHSFGKHHKRNKLVVDHCHNTGKVRGLLCTMCNKGIGLLGDTEENVSKALVYLKSNTDTNIH